MVASAVVQSTLGVSGAARGTKVEQIELRSLVPRRRVDRVEKRCSASHGSSERAFDDARAGVDDRDSLLLALCAVIALRWASGASTSSDRRLVGPLGRSSSRLRGL